MAWLAQEPSVLRVLWCLSLLALLAPVAPAEPLPLPYASHADPLRVLPEMALPSAAPACAEEDAFRVLYVMAPSTLDFFELRVPQIRAGIAAATGVVRESSLPHGVDVRLRFQCDAEGEVAITHVRVPTPPTAANYSTIVADLAAQGYDDARTKYWVLYEPVNSRCEGCAGEAHMWEDDRASVDNLNNAGAMYAVTYVGNFGLRANVATLTRVMLHEASHIMGAVQLSAPHSSGAGHCHDGADVMCQPEPFGNGARFDATVCPRLLVTWVGPELPYDCGQDDYFHPAPPAGSYLAEHWNLGSPLNRYIEWRRLE